MYVVRYSLESDGRVTNHKVVMSDGERLEAYELYFLLLITPQASNIEITEIKLEQDE